ncbi:hypothetical protein [Mechercharimyces sp. CAU 1602]|uniref:golvesin C-terminal-like domain-containing protein n=1 Tax=Mechercharimyces sp. CAU 1602 TaxID=2973933 RepID=UPI002162BA67|nr:hypothetical protein [Mechercharimyces sp. CAU 1602]MCS1350221.1 hypothetical protein [Mechercharimyces sp. CAU 1602]
MKWLKPILSLFFLVFVMSVMIGFKHVEFLSAQEKSIIEYYKEEWERREERKAESSYIMSHTKVNTVGTWSASTNAFGYSGANYQPNAKGTGEDTFTWAFKVKRSDQYQVFVHQVPAFDRASNAPFTVTHAQGEDTITVDQRSGNEWFELGTYSFDKDKEWKITLSDAGDGYVIADALKLVSVSDPDWDVVLENDR